MVRTIMLENSLAARNPELASEWHPDKNGDLMPDKVAPTSHKVVWWQCKEGHEWKASVNNRAHSRGCPYCSGRLPSAGVNDLETVNPTLAKQWDFELNGNLKPSDVLPLSNKKVWWKCEHGHEWYAAISDRSKGTGCPVCRGEQRHDTKMKSDEAKEMLMNLLGDSWHEIYCDKQGILLQSHVAPGLIVQVSMSTKRSPFYNPMDNDFRVSFDMDDEECHHLVTIAGVPAERISKVIETVQGVASNIAGESEKSFVDLYDGHFQDKFRMCVTSLIPENYGRYVFEATFAQQLVFHEPEYWATEDGFASKTFPHVVAVHYFNNDVRLLAYRSVSVKSSKLVRAVCVYQVKNTVSDEWYEMYSCYGVNPESIHELTDCFMNCFDKHMINYYTKHMYDLDRVGFADCVRSSVFCDLPRE